MVESNQNRNKFEQSTFYFKGSVGCVSSVNSQALMATNKISVTINKP